MPMTSDLPRVSNVSSNDVIVIVKNPNGAAQTSAIPVNSFLASVNVIASNSDVLFVTMPVGGTFDYAEHNGKMLLIDSAAPVNVYVGPGNMGANFEVLQLGEGNVTIQAATGAIVSTMSEATPGTTGEFSVAKAFAYSANAWLVQS